jgi:hypothetical protein
MAQKPSLFNLFMKKFELTFGHFPCLIVQLVGQLACRLNDQAKWTTPFWLIFAIFLLLHNDVDDWQKECGTFATARLSMSFDVKALKN